MLTEASRDWWLFLVDGLIAVIVGILVLIWPSQGWLGLVIAFGVFALLDGIFTLVAGIDLNRFFTGAWAVMLGGVLGIVVGVSTLIWVRQATLVWFYVIAAWAILSGILDIVAADRFRVHIPGEWSLILAGVLSILFGVLLIVYPGPGLIALVWVIGIFAIAYGIMELIFSSRLHKLGNAIKQTGLTGI